MEENIPRSVWMRRRVKKNGWTRVIGQLLFLIFIVPLLRKLSGKRITQILQQFELDVAPVDEKLITPVASVNADFCINQLKEIAPDLVMVNGTRIIAQKVLEAVDCPFVNIHAGITPYYRGVHGAYWALAQADPGRCGVTIHLVDKGIDTGGVIAQALIKPGTDDNFSTYPLLQLAEGLKLLPSALSALSQNKVEIKKSADKGKLYYHPTLGEYCRYYLKRGIK